MLSVTLAALLLAAASTPVDAQLELKSEGNGQVSVQLCFTSAQPHQVRYQLEVTSIGSAGTNRTRQSGELSSSNDRSCPLNNRVSVSENGRLEATLSWSIDGQPQPPMQRSYPEAVPASPTPEPQATPPGEPAEDPERLVASVRQTPLP